MPLPGDSLDVVPASPADAATIRRLAEAIWRKVYPPILSQEQIQFMLDWMYAPGQLRAELTDESIRYQLFRYREQWIGYSALHRGEAEGEVHLAKFYLSTDWHGRGLGSMALQILVEQARKQGATCLTLRVNRHNEPALRCYGRNGFRIVRDEVSEIGHGFVMDDHWMQLDLVASLTALEPGAPGLPRTRE